jgi:hypothetical protein
MDKIKRFFSGAGLTTDAEFDELIQFANIRVVKEEKIHISIVFEKIPDFSLIASLEKNKINDIVKDLVEINYRVRELKETSDELKTFLNYFININDLRLNGVLLDILSSYKILNNNLIFETTSDIASEIFNKKLNLLINFLNSYGLDFTKIDLHKTKDQNKIALHKKNIDEEIEKNIIKLNNEQIAKKVDFNKLNYIKEEPISIKVLNDTFSPDNKTLPVVHGVIIRVIKPERSGGAYEYYLKDDTGYITIKA